MSLAHSFTYACFYAINRYWGPTTFPWSLCRRYHHLLSTSVRNSTICSWIRHSSTSWMNSDHLSLLCPLLLSSLHTLSWCSRAKWINGGAPCENQAAAQDRLAKLTDRARSVPAGCIFRFSFKVTIFISGPNRVTKLHFLQSWGLVGSLLRIGYRVNLLPISVSVADGTQHTWHFYLTLHPHWLCPWITVVKTLDTGDNQ